MDARRSVSILCAALAMSCSPSADSLIAEVRTHTQAVMALHARTPPTPDNLPLLRKGIADYRAKHAAALAKLRDQAAALVDAIDTGKRAAVNAYCALDALLHPERRAAQAKKTLAAARTAKDFLARQKKGHAACRSALRGAK